jgi:hypothetical protein
VVRVERDGQLSGSPVSTPTPTALPIHEATTEVDRYISWPGQALSYYIGYLRLRELPAEAERERLIRDWIGKRKAAG